MPTIRIAEDTANILKKMARPLEDTWDTYLSRAARFLCSRQSEFLAFEAVASGDVDEAGAGIGGHSPATPTREGSISDLAETTRTLSRELPDRRKTPGEDATASANGAVDNYAKTKKLDWVAEHMTSWILRTELLRQAELAFPKTPMSTLNGTIGQDWTDCTNAKYDRPFRKRGMRSEERRSQGVHEKRIVAL